IGIGTTVWSARRWPHRPAGSAGFVARDRTVVVLVELAQRLGGVVDLVFRNRAVAVGVERAEERVGHGRRRTLRRARWRVAGVARTATTHRLAELIERERLVAV